MLSDPSPSDLISPLREELSPPPLPSAVFALRALVPEFPLAGSWLCQRRNHLAAGQLATLGADFSLLESPQSSEEASGPEPRIARQKNVLIWRLPSGRTLRCLLDSGAELDMLDAQVVQSEAWPLHRLLAPLHLRLGTAGKSDRLAHFAVADFVSGTLSLPSRPFFVGNVSGYDAILGLPFIEDAGVHVGSGAVTQVPIGPSVAMLRADEMEDQDLLALGYTQRAMSEEEVYCFSAVRAIMEATAEGQELNLDEWEVSFPDDPDCLTAYGHVAMVVAPGDPGVTVDDEIIAAEPHNPLLDVVDDPSLPDLSESEALSQLDTLLAEFSDVFVDKLPMDKLPPFRPVNHFIPLIDPDEKVRVRPYPMPHRYREQWDEQVTAYTKAGWWNPGSLDSACALFAIPKKEAGKARFVINLKPRNANTRKMRTPIPDMRSLRVEVASSPYRSKVDFTAAFEQVRVVPQSVKDTGFTTQTGTFTSKVMQFGDTNAPDTLNQTTHMMFQPCAKFLKIFFDDVHLHSLTRRAHLRHIRIMLMTLRWYRFYLGKNKSEWFTKSMLSLGSVISDKGIDVDPDKWNKVIDWPTPRSRKDILRFMGTVNWMRDHLPHLATLAEPLTRLTRLQVPWSWGPHEQRAFDAIKQLIPLTLRPIDWEKIKSGEHHLFMFADASIHGIGAHLSSGPTRDTAVPARLWSAKFNPAQLNYSTTDQEFLALCAGATEFQDSLIGWHATFVSDHEPLKAFWATTPTLTRRHVRMANELSRFDFDIEFIPGRDNHIADSLSRIWECTEFPVHDSDYVQEPDLDSLFFDSAPSNVAECAALVPQLGSKWHLPLQDLAVPENIRSAAAAAWRVRSTMGESAFARQSQRATAHLAPVQRRQKAPLAPPAAPLALQEVEPDHDPLDLLTPLKPVDLHAPLPAQAAPLVISMPASFTSALPAAYRNDARYSEILAHPALWPSFEVTSEQLIFRTEDGARQLCIPRGRMPESAELKKPPTFREFVLTTTHKVVGHQHEKITLSHLRRFFWWEQMIRDTCDFCRSCEPCARGKSGTQAPFGLLHPMPIPSRPWETAALDFVTGLPAVLYNREMVDAVLCVSDPFGKMIHLFALSGAATAQDVARIYHDGVYKHHGLQTKLVSDRDPKFTAGFWQEYQKIVGVELLMSTVDHAETDGFSENRIKSSVNSIRILAEDNPDNWPFLLTEVEFGINSSVSSTTKLAPFEATNGWLPSPWPLAPAKVGSVPAAAGFAESTRINWQRATDAIIAARLDMAVQANKHRREDSPEFAVGNKVYVSTKSLSFPPGMSRKFIPRYVGPYLITGAVPETSSYDIQFPPHFKVHPRVHASKLRPHFPNDEERFPARHFSSPPEVNLADPVKIGAPIEKIIWDYAKGRQHMFMVRFLGLSSSEDRWLSETVLRNRAPELLADYIAQRGGNLRPAGEKRVRRVK